MTTNSNITFNKKPRVDFLTLIEGATEDATEKTSSQLDKKMRLGQDSWTVTMICYVGTNHAQLVIEGVNALNKVFLVIAELNGMNKTIFKIPYGYKDLGEVNYSLRNERSRLKYDGKSETWHRTRAIMLQMTDAIDKEHLDPKNNPVPFHICGDRSMFASQIVHVKDIGPQIDLAKNNKGFYILIAAAALLGIAAYGTKYSESVQAALMANQQEFEIMRKSFMDNADFYVEFLMFKKSFPRIEDAVEYIKLMSKFTLDMADTIFKVMAELHKQTQPEVIMANMTTRYKDKKICLLNQHNCCTWGKAKLAIIGIDFPVTEEQRFFTITRRITNPNEVPIGVPKLLSCSEKKVKANENISSTDETVASHRVSEKRRSIQQFAYEEGIGFARWLATPISYSLEKIVLSKKNS